MVRSCRAFLGLVIGEFLTRRIALANKLTIGISIHKRQRTVRVANINRVNGPDGADSLSDVFGDREVLAWVYSDAQVSHAA